MALTKEWSRRIQIWIDELKRQVYHPLGSLDLEGFTTFDRLTPEQASQGPFRPFPVGTTWGAKWEYGWFRGRVELPLGQTGRVVVRLSPGLEGLVFVNGRAAGARDREHLEITLTRRARGGETYDLLAEFYGGHGPIEESVGPVPPGRHPLPEPGATQKRVEPSTWGTWDDEAFGLLIDAEALWQTRNALAETSLRVSQIDEALRKFTLAVDFEQPLEARQDSYRQGRRILKPLLACVNGSTAPQFHIFGNSHLDLAWQWPWEETLRKSARTVSTQLALLDEYPDYRFFWCQVPLFEALRDHYPELWQRTRAFIDQGRILVDGGMGIEPDTNLPGGESLIRQVLWAREFYIGELGQSTRVLWLPDTFGFSAALPQIMKGTGLEFFATKKIIDNYNDSDRFPLVTFRWKGLDGTEVLAHVYRKCNSPIDPQTLVRRWEVDRLQKDHVASYLFPFGFGDGGGGPTRTHLEYTQRLKDLEGLPRTQWSHPAGFFDDLVTRGPVEEVYSGELYFPEHRGTYTSQARIKRGNRQAEVALREAELWQAVARVWGSTPNQDELKALWRTLLFQHFHDILAGASIRRVNEEAEAALASVRSGADELVSRALRTEGPGQTLYNSLSWERTVLVEVGGQWTSVVVPALGWTTIPPSAPTAPQVTLRQEGVRWILENRHLRVEVDHGGLVTSLVDKASGLEILEGDANVFRMYKDVNNDYDAWDIASIYPQLEVPLGDAEVTVGRSSPWFATLVVRRTLGNSPLELEICLNADARQVEFRGHLDWREDHKLLRVDFPTRLRADEALYEIQFGHVRRPTHRNRRYDADRFEGCHHKWLALAEASRGVALINDGKYGGSVKAGTLGLTLLKSAYVPDPRADRGPQEFAYALAVWNGSFAEEGPIRPAYEFNVPLRWGEGRREPGSLATIDSKAVVLEAWKLAEDSSGDTVLRLYEATGSGTVAILRLHVAFEKYWVTDMTETAQGPGSPFHGELRLEFGPFEIKTLRLRGLRERSGSTRAESS